MAMGTICARLSCTSKRKGRLFDDSGAAAVEFALIFPVFAVVLCGAADAALLASRARQADALAAAASQELARLPEIPAAPPISIQQAGAVSYPTKLPTVSLSDLVALPDDASGQARLFWGCAGPDGVEEVSFPQCEAGRAAAYSDVRLSLPVIRLFSWPESIIPTQVHVRSTARVG